MECIRYSYDGFCTVSEAHAERSKMSASLGTLAPNATVSMPNLTHGTPESHKCNSSVSVSSPLDVTVWSGQKDASHGRFLVDRLLFLES